MLRCSLCGYETEKLSADDNLAWNMFPSQFPCPDCLNQNTIEKVGDGK